MNLQVNLLHRHESSSAAGVHRRKVLRMAALGLVGVALLAVAQIGFSMVALRAELAATDLRWRQLASEHDQVVRVQTALDGLRRQLAELSSFSNAQLRVAGRLYTVACALPAGMQFSELALNQTLADLPGSTARKYELKVVGRTYGESGSELVGDFIERLKRTALTEHDMGAVRPGGFSPSAAGGRPNEYTFEVLCLFEPRSLK